MGTTKLKNGDNRIIYHVGKHLPKTGEGILLVPGVQNAQGRGVYCSETVQLKYAGGEHYRVVVETIPVFCIPMSGPWTKAKLKKNDLIVFHSTDRVVALNNLRFTEAVNEEGRTIRYYWTDDISFFPEPVSMIFDEFSKQVRGGYLSYAEAMQFLREQRSVPELKVEPSIIIEALQKAMEHKEIPIISELEHPREDAELFQEGRRRAA